MFKALLRFYRFLPGKLPNHLIELSNENKTNAEVWHAVGNYGGMYNGMIQGDPDHGYASFGLKISFIYDIVPVSEVGIYSGVSDNQK